jgi:hypothetical protein
VRFQAVVGASLTHDLTHQPGDFREMLESGGH